MADFYGSSFCLNTVMTRLGKEAVGDLTLHHHAPALDRRHAVDAFDDQGRGDVVGKVGHELGGWWIECG